MFLTEKSPNLSSLALFMLTFDAVRKMKIRVEAFVV